MVSKLVIFQISRKSLFLMVVPKKEHKSKIDCFELELKYQCLDYFPQVEKPL